MKYFFSFLLFSILLFTTKGISERKGVDYTMNSNILFMGQINNPIRPDLALIPESSDLVNSHGFTNVYFQLQDFYARIVWNWLDDQVNIAHYETELKNDPLLYLPSTEPVNAFQEKYSFGKGLFFIRNIFCIERLSAEELAELRALEKTQDTASDQCRAFVAATLRKMCIVYSDFADTIKVVHEGDGKSAPNVSIILGLTIEINLSSDDLQLEQQKFQTLSKRIPELEERLTNAAGFPIAIFLYFN